MTYNTASGERPCKNEFCGANIPVSRGVGARHCSQRCKNTVNIRNYRARLTGKPRSVPPAERTCARSGCDATITVERARFRARYCSPVCARAARARAVPERRCARSGCERAITGDRAQRGARYCSTECARTAHDERSRAHALARDGPELSPGSVAPLAVIARSLNGSTCSAATARRASANSRREPARSRCSTRSSKRPPSAMKPRRRCSRASSSPWRSHVRRGRGRRAHRPRPGAL